MKQKILSDEIIYVFNYLIVLLLIITIELNYQELKLKKKTYFRQQINYGRN